MPFTMTFMSFFKYYFKNAVTNFRVHTNSFTGTISECDVIYGYVTWIGNARYSFHDNLWKSERLKVRRENKSQLGYSPLW